MSQTTKGPRLGSWATLAAATLALSLAVAGCDNLLEVELPAQLGDEAVNDPAGADSQISSIIGQFERAYDLSLWEFHGREDGGEIRLASPGTNSGDLSYGTAPTGATDNWYQFYMTSLRFATIMHDHLDKDWTAKQVAKRQQYLALSSLYAGATLNVLGSAMCEVSIRSSKMMTPDEALTQADAMLTRALSEIGAADFAVPFGVSTSARTMALGLRAQARWMKGDKAGALADAQLIPKGFTAWVTRDGSPARRNKAYWVGPYSRYAELYDVNDWWKPSSRINPATGQAWPANIPFTGYPYLGIRPDGRAVRDDGLPIRVTGGKASIPGVEPTAVPDSRVKYILAPIQGSGAGSRPIHAKYADLGSFIPLVNWKEIWLIRAELAGGQTAIDLVNELRAADNLPKVTYANPANATQIRYLIVEERRRALFLEGRFVFTKIRNPDLLWFPRADGLSPGAGRALGGGVRFQMPDNEYLLNPNLTLQDRGTKCNKNEAPIITV